MPAKHLPYHLGGLLYILVTISLGLLFPLAGWGQDTPNAIRVGVLHFPPHMILDDRAPPRGFAIDVLEAVAARAGVALQYVVIPEWSETLQALRDKHIDLIPGMGVTDERRQWFAFTAPIEVTPVRLFVRADTTTISGLDDLGGRSVSVVQDNVGARLMQRHRAQYTDVEILIHASREEALLALLAGQSDALVYPVNVLRHGVRQVGLEDRIKTVGMPLLEIKRALAIRPDRPALLARLDRAVQAFISSPAYQAIFTRWYGRPAPFWTVKTVGLVMGCLLIVTIAVLVTWRYRSVVRLNAQLTTAHQFLQSTLDALSAHIAILDETGTVLAVNAAWHRFAEANGFSGASHGVGADYLTMCDRATDGRTEEAAEIAQGIRDVMAGQRDYFAHEYACHSPEEQRWFMVRCTSFASSAGQRVVMAHENITTRKQAEQAVRESEERFRQITETIQEFFWMSDPHLFRYLYVSPAYETIWERPCESLYDNPRSWLQAVHPEDREIGHSTLEALHRGEPSDVEYRILLPDGSIRWIRDRGFPITDSSGQVYRLTGAAEDITERKQAEDDRQRLEAQLRQSQKMEAVGTLAGGIAHDFNNVLGAIFIHTEVAKSYAYQGGEIWNCLQEVLTAAGRAKNLVQQILTFSHQSEMNRQPVRLTSVIQDTLALLRASLPTTIDIRQSLPEQGDSILADSTQVHQIVLNLCVNAEHAMRETGGILDINVDRVEVDDACSLSCPDLAPGPYVRLTISDSGHGMTPEVRERIFDPFFTTKGVGEGTGMGLAMVHGIVAGHGGATTVESQPGIGTTFTLYFPCLPEFVAESTPSQDAISHRSGSIMVVDDEPMLASGMQDLLTRLGYKVVSYTSSQEALAAFEAQPGRFDLVITDQTMPQITGEQLVRKLRQYRPDIPIILCTGFSHVMNVNKATQLGIDAFCMKPLDLGELTRTIDRVLGHPGDIERKVSPSDL